MVRCWQGARYSASNARAGAGRLSWANKSWTRRTRNGAIHENPAAIGDSELGVEPDGRVHGRPELPSARCSNSHCVPRSERKPTGPGSGSFLCGSSMVAGLPGSAITRTDSHGGEAEL